MQIIRCFYREGIRVIFLERDLIVFGRCRISETLKENDEILIQIIRTINVGVDRSSVVDENIRGRAGGQGDHTVNDPLYCPRNRNAIDESGSRTGNGTGLITWWCKAG